MFGQDAQNPLSRKAPERSQKQDLSSKGTNRQGEKDVDRGPRRNSKCVLSGRPFFDLHKEEGVAEINQTPSQQMDCEYDAAWDRMTHFDQASDSFYYPAYHANHSRSDHNLPQESRFIDHSHDLLPQNSRAPSIRPPYQQHQHQYISNQNLDQNFPPRYAAISRLPLQPPPQYLPEPAYYPPLPQRPVQPRDDKAHLINMFSSFLHHMDNQNH